jgi:hypothetical protein
MRAMIESESNTNYAAAMILFAAADTAGCRRSASAGSFSSNGWSRDGKANCIFVSLFYVAYCVGDYVGKATEDGDGMHG